MNEQDEKLLEQYLKDIKKKNLLIVIIVVLIIGSVITFGVYFKTKKISSSNEQNNISYENEINIINDNETEENIVLNTIEQENTEVVNKVQEKKEVEDEQGEKENKVAQDNEKQNKQSEKSSKTSETKTTQEKPANKDFLFTDGYTMENVTQAAENYLKSFNASGECIPIKDSEGVYLGMRVIFY